MQFDSDYSGGGGASIIIFQVSLLLGMILSEGILLI